MGKVVTNRQDCSKACVACGRPLERGERIFQQYWGAGHPRGHSDYYCLGCAAKDESIRETDRAEAKRELAGG